MKILVIDSGIGLQHVIRMKEEGHDVYYYIPWQSPYPKFQRYIIGEGFVDKVEDPFQVFEKVDFVVFTDSGFPDMADYMRRYKPVFGGGSIEELENDRFLLKRFLGRIGLKTSNYKVIKGIQNLLDYTKKYFESSDRTLYIKISKFRGDLETFGADNYDYLESSLYYLGKVVGPFSDEIVFVVEEELDGEFVEIGIDTFFDGNDFYRLKTFGLEVKTHTVVKFVENSVYDDVLNKLKIVFHDLGYRGPFSMEALCDGENLYITDFTCRYPYPISMMFPLYIKNYTDFIYSIAQGKPIDMEIEGEMDDYYGTTNVYIDYDVHDRWLKLDWEEKDDIKVAVRSAVKKNDIIYNVPVEGESLVLTLLYKNKNIKTLFKTLSDYYNNFIKIPTVDIKGDFSDVFDKDIRILRSFGIDF